LSGSLQRKCCAPRGQHAQDASVHLLGRRYGRRQARAAALFAAGRAPRGEPGAYSYGASSTHERHNAHAHAAGARISCPAFGGNKTTCEAAKLFNFNRWEETWARGVGDGVLKPGEAFDAGSALPALQQVVPPGQINDYAAKSWGGLVSSYYKPRHELFTKMVLASLQPGAKPFAQGDYAAAWMAQIGLPWSNATDAMPVQPVGDTVAVASKLYAKYIGVL